MTQSTQNIGMVRAIDSVTGAQRFSHQAMATIYEILIVHEDANYAHQAACESFYELDRLELELSRFIENSDISRINRLDVNQSTKIGLAAFECLRLSAQIYEETNGAFDITIGPLLKCWLNHDKTPRVPSEEEIKRALQQTGQNLLQLDENQHSVKVQTRVHVDLGGIGKGYAVDQLVKLLRDWEIDTALIHGGASSVYALGAPPETKGWPLTLSVPGNQKQTLARLYMRDRSLSGSGVQKGQHIIDPRTGQPVKGNCAAWACASGAASADALSTAFMMMTPDEVEKYCARNRDVAAMIVTGESNEGEAEISHFGRWDER